MGAISISINSIKLRAWGLGPGVSSLCHQCLPLHQVVSILTSFLDPTNIIQHSLCGRHRGHNDEKKSDNLYATDTVWWENFTMINTIYIPTINNTTIPNQEKGIFYIFFSRQHRILWGTLYTLGRFFLPFLVIFYSTSNIGPRFEFCVKSNNVKCRAIYQSSGGQKFMWSSFSFE